MADGGDVSDYARLTAASRALAADLKSDPAVMARGLDPGFKMRPHTRVIGQSMSGVLCCDYDRLLVITPPQVGKSTLVAEWGPFWWLANRPKDDLVIASYGLDLALDRSKGVRQRIADYGAEYGLLTRPGSEAAHDWELRSGAHLRAVGIGGGLSGFPANLIFVDDPHKDRADAESPRMRRIEEGGRWKVVHLPAIADPKFGPDPIGRAPGEPLTHPKIPTRDRARLAAWWAGMKRTSMVRDWHSLAQGDPQPTEGALVSAELLEAIRDSRTVVEPQKVAVAVDPSGGGRDTAGVVGGFLGDDGRLWITHDRSGVMSSADWSRVACLLAHETGAAVIYCETNFGGDMCLLAIRTAWEYLVREGRIPADVLPPQVKAVRARQGKVLRAEPVAQQMVLDRVRLRGILPDLEHEWCVWQPTDPGSPGRIDASVYLAYGLLPLPAAGHASALGVEQLQQTNLLPWGGG
jgi:hypothetical protein